MSRKYLVLLGLLTTFSALFSSPLLAGNTRSSGAKEVAFAFYKTGGITPDFRSLAKRLPVYRTTPLTRQEEVISREAGIMKRDFDDYKAGEGLITLKAEVIPEPTGLTDAKDINRKNVKIRFKGGQVEYFPYEFMGNHFAVIVNDLEKRMNVYMSAEQHRVIADAVKRGGEFTLVLKLRPIKADISHPYEVDGKEQWALLCDIASMSLFVNDTVLLWSYTAPWYFTPLGKELLGIKENSKNEENNKENSRPYHLNE